MSASTKPVLGRQLRGMRHLESRILDLQNQYQHLLNQRQQDITAIIGTLNLASLEDPLIIRGLLFIKKKVTAKDPIMEVWRDAGETFLRRAKPKIRSRESAKNCPFPRESREQTGDFSRPRGAEQAGASSRIPSGKNISSKQTPPPPATAQSPQTRAQSREAYDEDSATIRS